MYKFFNFFYQDLNEEFGQGSTAMFFNPTPGDLSGVQALFQPGTSTSNSTNQQIINPFIPRNVKLESIIT